jgi:UDP-N-acetylglucosamine 2-epimerase (non-hydrolysing)
LRVKPVQARVIEFAVPRTIGVVTVARSDYGHLFPLLDELHRAPDVALRLYVAGAHLSDRFGQTVRLIEADGWPIAARIDTLEPGDDAVAIARGAGRAVGGFAAALGQAPPDLLLVLGDRLEMLAAAVAALPLTVPVAHVHGGESTEGAIDEQARHAITKLAHLHFPAAEPFAARLRQMGEEPWRVHCCGAPGLDRLRMLRPLPREALAARLGVPLSRPTLLVTLHPATLGGRGASDEAAALTAALEHVDATIVATYPGADAAYGPVVQALERFAARRSNARLLPSLGDDVYVSLLREVDLMVGNSSSGIIEAPSFGLPVVNIGDRQRGRLRAQNVIDVVAEARAILAGIRRGLAPEFRAGLHGRANPYGDGHAAERIARVLRQTELGLRLLQKRFVDLPARP